jgi:hypothetical protein
VARADTKTRYDRRYKDMASLPPHLKRSKLGFYSYRRGVPKALRPKTMHSTRHTMKDAFRDAGVPKEIYDLVQGHGGGDASSGYGTSELLERKREAITKALEKVGVSTSPELVPQDGAEDGAGG